MAYRRRRSSRRPRRSSFRRRRGRVGRIRIGTRF